MFFRRRAGDRFIDRGDLAAYDLTTGDFTKDSAWHDLDLSAICGKGIHRLLIALIMSSSDVPAQIALRQNGNTNGINQGVRIAPAIGLAFVDDVEVLTDADGVIEYQILTGTYETINLVVRGCHK